MSIMKILSNELQFATSTNSNTKEIPGYTYLGSFRAEGFGPIFEDLNNLLGEEVILERRTRLDWRAIYIKAGYNESRVYQKWKEVMA